MQHRSSPSASPPEGDSILSLYSNPLFNSPSSSMSSFGSFPALEDSLPPQGLLEDVPGVTSSQTGEGFVFAPPSSTAEIAPPALPQFGSPSASQFIQLMSQMDQIQLQMIRQALGAEVPSAASPLPSSTSTHLAERSGVPSAAPMDHTPIRPQILQFPTHQSGQASTSADVLREAQTP